MLLPAACQWRALRNNIEVCVLYTVCTSMQACTHCTKSGFSPPHPLPFPSPYSAMNGPGSNFYVLPYPFRSHCQSLSDTVICCIQNRLWLIRWLLGVSMVVSAVEGGANCVEALLTCRSGPCVRLHLPRPLSYQPVYGGDRIRHVRLHIAL